ncbi:DUF2971 domain-containing protein [Tissierella praeacuta]|uniref:DUF2971 domain-containing protein n=1 Tax=Tissierella praeacuta TaxID=43131 RepID=UPI0010D4A1E4|nr:DUF2971 domain-containing protein [Tissierella praeacuta]TCU72865.1 DUF2971 family protein [Tissierella praeacuta]
MELDRWKDLNQEYADFLAKYKLDSGNNIEWCEKPKPTLYHYTTINVLFNILSSGELWATKYSYLNDRSEIEYGLELLKKRINLVSTHKKMLSDSIESLKQQTLSDYYLVCFSSEKDSIPMWNYYGNHDGYNIGFKKEFFDLFYMANIENSFSNIVLKKSHLFREETSGIPFDFASRKVIYDKDFQCEILDFIIRLTDKCIDNNETYSYWRLIFGLVSDHIIFMKNDAFEYENEYRIVFKMEKDYKHCIHFRTSKGSLIPHLIIQTKMDQFIKEINIGPFNKSDMAESGLREFLDYKQLIEVPIYHSRLPNRF